MNVKTLGYQFTVSVDNEFEGRQFVLRDEREIIAFGISPHSVKNALCQRTLLFGMRVDRINLSRATFAPYDDIRKLFLVNKLYFSPSIKPIIGEVMEECPYKGLRFSLYGNTEVDSLFAKTGVLLALRRKQSRYRGCQFAYAIHRDAIPLHGFMTREISEYLKAHYTRHKKESECNIII